MPNTPKPKDLTSQLVRYRSKSSLSLSQEQAQRKRTQMRKHRFDPFSYAVWLFLAFLLASQPLILSVFEWL